MATIQVILTKDVDNLGRAGELVRVRPGYGRNYLFPAASRSRRPAVTSPRSSIASA